MRNARTEGGFSLVESIVALGVLTFGLLAMAQGSIGNAMAEFEDSRADLASLSVLLRQIRTLVRASAA